jgi:energy-coupling factor transport system ATP-binding protein
MVNKGEFVALMGQNGAGKTTLVKHFNGLLRPSEGDVLVNGVNTREMSVAKLSQTVGYVFQNPDNQLFCETVEEEVAFALKNFGYSDVHRKRRVNWALNLLGLTAYQKSSPFLLSGGERKRVALASVLAWNPQVIVMDEPTIGQDYNQKEKLRQFIVQLNTQGKTVIVVTHDIEFVAECNPRIILMSNGKIIGDGPSKQMLTNVGLLSQASIIPPQITEFFLKVSDLDFPSDVFDIYEGKELLTKRLMKK